MKEPTMHTLITYLIIAAVVFPISFLVVWGIDRLSHWYINRTDY